MKHLFLLTGNGGGSSLLHHVLSKCHYIVYTKEETQVMFPKLLTDLRDNKQHPFQLYIENYQDESKYNWDDIKKKLHSAWKWNDDNRIYLAKSTLDFTRWKMINEHFENVHFIVMFRHPLSHIEGLKRKGGHLCTWGEVAQGYVNMMRCQDECLRKVEKSTWIRYEDLCLENDMVYEKITKLIPEIGDLNIKNVVFRHPHRPKPYLSREGIEKNVDSIAKIRKDKAMDDILKVLSKNHRLINKYYKGIV